MDNIIHCTIRLQCSPRHAFEMFTLNHNLERWLAKVAEVEPVAGGKYELFWEPEDRENNSTIGCRITSIIPDQFLSFEWRSPKQFKHFANIADPLTHVVVFFIPILEFTDLHIVHSGWRSAAEWEEARQWQEKVWQAALQSLENLLKSKPA